MSVSSREKCRPWNSTHGDERVEPGKVQTLEQHLVRQPDGFVIIHARPDGIAERFGGKVGTRTDKSIVGSPFGMRFAEVGQQGKTVRGGRTTG